MKITVLIFDFITIGWGILLKNGTAQFLWNEFYNITQKSIPKPSVIEIDDGQESLFKIFRELLSSKDIKRFSGYNSKGAVFVEMYNRTKRDLLKS